MKARIEVANPKGILTPGQARRGRRPGQPPPLTWALLEEAIREGAVLRVRPKVMTVAVILAGLLPIMASGGTGAAVMQRIAAPMVWAAWSRLCCPCSSFLPPTR